MGYIRNFTISVVFALSLCRQIEACSNITSKSCIFLSIIFEKYGFDNRLPFEGYEHLIENLDLAGIVIDHGVQTHKTKSSAGFIDIHENHDHVREPETGHGHEHDKSGDHTHTNGHDHAHKVENDHSHEDGSNHVHEDGHTHKGGNLHTKKDGHDNQKQYNNSGHVHEDGHDHSGKHVHDEKMTSQEAGHDHRLVRRSTQPDVKFDTYVVVKKCLTPRELLEIYGFQGDSLTRNQFLDLCPAIILQLDLQLCRGPVSVGNQYVTDGQSNTKSSKAVWGYGCAAILVISIMGMFAVGLISAIQRFSVSLVLQFFVSLAVGALLGDAFLHLLPHALQAESGHSHGEGGETGGHGYDGIKKGLCGLGLILFFYLIGRIQGIIASNKLRKKLMRDEVHLQYSEEVTVLNGKSGVLERLQKELEDIENIQLESIDNTHHHNNSGHGHSHGGDPPTTAGAMVWRVIVGDGIHNFSDGLAIGVAFSHSVTGGVSTAIAVLCHELPHEMGDFAVLLKKGMSIKRAFLYNCLSSVLSLIGVFIGIAVGNIQAVNLYVFVCVAAMFIYISLVDMLPEISTCDSSRPLKQLFCQVCGILMGYGIMLTIALKEEDLKKILDT